MLRLLLGVGVYAALAVSASAGRVNFDDLAGRLATELKKFREGRASACTYCPIPPYSDGARKMGISPATVVLMVTVSINGIDEEICVVKNPGYGLAEQAIESVSEWRFRPASGKDGKPVSAAVPVEVSSHLFENGKEITRAKVMG